MDEVLHERTLNKAYGEKYNKSYIGQTFNYLTITDIGKDKYNKKAFICKCECGNIKIIKPTYVVNGIVKSCGCKKNELCAGINKSKNPVNNYRLYKIYRGMIERCHDKNNKNYGGRGIKVCDEWENDFKAFEKWAYESRYDINAEHFMYTLDRINVNKGYSPNNCRWITNKEQQRNKRNNIYVQIDGETKILSQWKRENHLSNYALLKQRGLIQLKNKKYDCNGEKLSVREMSKRYGMIEQTIAYRIKKGMTASEAVNVPKKPNGRKRKDVNSDISDTDFDNDK